MERVETVSATNRSAETHTTTPHSPRSCGSNCQYTDRAATATDDLQGRGDDDRAGRGQPIQVREAGEAKPARAVHDRVVREGWVEAARLPGVRPDRLDADAEDIPLVGQEF